MRNNLIMNLYCGECGTKLNILLDKEISKELDSKINPDPWGRNSPELETGANNYHIPKIAVMPCRGCFHKHNGPAIKLKEAIKDLAL